MGPLRRVIARVAIIGCCLALSGTGLVRAQTELPPASGAVIDKVGWWNRTSVGVEGPTGLVSPPAPPTIPEGSVAVGAALGDPDKVGAIGIQPEAAPGDTISAFTLRIAELDGQGANVNTGDPTIAIVACPIAEFWTGGHNLPWDQQPEADCDAASVRGERDGEGVWTFDLLPVGTAWVDPASAITADGVLLQPEAAAPISFQAVLDPTTIELSIASEPGAATDDAFDTPEGSFDSGSSGGFDTGSGGSTSFDSPTFDDGGTVDLDPPPVADDGAGAAPPTSAPENPEVAGQPLSSGRPGFADGVPLVLVPLFLLLMLATSFALGPHGEPAVTVRQGGVSRALAARERSAHPEELL